MPSQTERERVHFFPPTVHDSTGDAIAAFLLGGGWVGGTAIGALLASGAAALLVGGGAVLAGAGVIVFPSQRLRLHDLTTRRRVARARRRASGAAPVAEARVGADVYVRGRVHVLQGVPTSGGDAENAAVVRRSRVRLRCRCTPLCRAEYDALETRWRCGRFAIVDDSGVAVVDGTEPRSDGAAPLDVWPRDADGAPADADPLVLSHGDEVHVFGRVREAEAPDASILAQATYRDHRQLLVFEPGALLLI